MLIISLLALLAPTFASSADGKMDLRELSRNFSSKRPVGNPIEASWVKDAGTGGVTGYRHFHAMATAAVFAKNEENRKTAKAWVEKYECENWLACDNAKSFYSTIWIDVPKEKIHSGDEAWVKEREKAAEKRRDGMIKPREIALCSPESSRATWLEQEYDLLCPLPAAKAPLHLCPKCLDTAWLKQKIEFDSLQALMSSAYLEDFAHDTRGDCARPWTAKIKCGGMQKVEYGLRCQRGKDRKVKCENMPVKVGG